MVDMHPVRYNKIPPEIIVGTIISDLWSHCKVKLSFQDYSRKDKIVRYHEARKRLKMPWRLWSKGKDLGPLFIKKNRKSN